MPKGTISVSLKDVTKMIDHALLQPNMTDADILDGLRLARDLNVATACIKPYFTARAKKELEGSSVAVCAVIGFPHGNSMTGIKVLEAEAAVAAGSSEIDMVVNVGKVLSGDWIYVEDEIRAVNHSCVSNGAILKVIFENDLLQYEHIEQLCRICSRVQVAYAKTSSGYGFVKQASGDWNYKGATPHHIKLMKKSLTGDVKLKAAGGVRTLDELLYYRSLGVSRIGCSAAKAIVSTAKERGIGDSPVEVAFVYDEAESHGGY